MPDPMTTELEQLVRDEMWNRDWSFCFNPDRGWFVLAGLQKPTDELTVMSGPTDTAVAAAQAALAKDQQ